MNRFYDSHTHSHFSFDGSESVEVLCRAAIEKGLEGICITDHCDLGRYSIENWESQMSGSVLETLEARERYRGVLEVTVGIELGQPQEEQLAAARALALESYDFVIGSLHNLPDTDDFYYLNPQKMDVKRLLTRYFDEVLKIVHWNGFDSLGHITYPLRYIAGEGGVKINLSDYEEQLREIMKELAQRGKALEINTSGLRQRLGETMPGAYCLKLFKECGGEYVTIGSDAHQAEHVGTGFLEAARLLTAHGFGYLTFYRSRRPVMLAL